MRKEQGRLCLETWREKKRRKNKEKKIGEG
jgi:hypothetical protein